MNIAIRNRPAKSRAKASPTVAVAVPAPREPLTDLEYGRAWYHDAAIVEAERAGPRAR